MASSSRPGSGRTSRGATHNGPPTEQESLFWSSMQLLGFGDGHSAAGVTELGPTMFRRVNGGGMDCVLHFLFALLRGEDALRRELRGCWPPQDGKQRTEWKKAVRGYLEQLAQEGVVPKKLVTSASSLLHTASGPRLVELLSYLSHHVLRVVHERSFPQDVASLPPALEPALELTPAALELLAEPILNVAVSRVTLARDGFLSVAEKASRMHRSWRSAADELTSQYRRLLAQDTRLQHEVAQFKEATMGISELAQAEEANEAESLWNELRGILNSCNGLAEASDVIVYGQAHPHAISGKELLGLSNDSVPHSSSDSGLDVSALLEAWTGRVMDVQASISSLARSGQKNNHIQPAMWTETDTGHMLHLKTTLKAHKENRSALVNLKYDLQSDVEEISKRIQQLQVQVDSLMACKYSYTSSMSCGASPGEASRMPKPSPLRFVPPTPAADRAGAVVTVHTPTPSVWTTDASQADDSVLSVCRQSYGLENSTSEITPESTLGNPCYFQGQPNNQRTPEIAKDQILKMNVDERHHPSCPPPDTIERQFSAGLAFEENDEYSLLDDFQMPLQALSCNLASSISSPAAQVTAPCQPHHLLDACLPAHAASASSMDLRTADVRSQVLKGKELPDEPTTPPSPGVFWDENGSPYVA